MDIDRLIFALVILSALAFIFLALPILVQTLWRARDLRGMSVALLIKLLIADVWMISFLGVLMINRLFKLGAMNDYFLIALGGVLLLRPVVFWIWFLAWERRIKKECRE